MKTVMILFFILCAALSIRAASVTATVQQKEKSALEPESDVVTDVAAEGAAAPRQARFGFCLNGWHSYRGNCYYLSNDPDTWSNAQSFCAGYGSNLASVHNIWDYTYLQRLVQTGGHAFAWIGGYYFQGEWRWGDGSLFDYYNFEMVSNTDSYQCLQLNSQESSGWSNHGCSMRFPFVCKLSLNC